MTRARRAIAWFRRDLRLADHRMLAAATRQADAVFPVFVADPAMLARNAAARGRVAWFGQNLRALDESLRAQGSSLTVLEGDPAEALRSFAHRVGADAVYATRDVEPAAIARDRRVAALVALHVIDDQMVAPPGILRTASGEPYRTYTPFRRALERWLAEYPAALEEARPELTRLAQPPAVPAGSFDPGPIPDWLPAAGPTEATERLRRFIREDLPAYAEERDRPDLDRTSHLSPYLRVGALSVRSAWRTAMAAIAIASGRRDERMEASARSWRNELAWREFFATVLSEKPHAVEGGLRPEYATLEWESGPAADRALAAWREGRTGYPIVDAAMRQLVATGWMHNRLRLVTASFLVKDLGIDWRRGEAVFMEHLIDGDLAQNNGNWQWVAGVGSDAAPYFRIFNPIRQARRFDPDAAFVWRWLPDVAELPAKYIHEPWRLPARERPRGYPPPIVDHADARLRTLARYREARKG